MQIIKAVQNSYLNEFDIILLDIGFVILFRGYDARYLST